MRAFLLLLFCVLLQATTAMAQGSIVTPPTGGKWTGGDRDDVIRTDQNIDFRLMDDVLFPSWRKETDSTQVVDESNSDSTAATGYTTGDHYVSGVIGANNDNSLLLDFFSRFADILIMWVAPVLLFIVVFNGVQMIILEDSGKRAATKASFVNMLIGLAFVIFAYSLIKIIFFFLTQ